MKAGDVLKGLEQGAAILRVLGPLGEELLAHLNGGDGPEPKLLVQIPELRAPAALERARMRSKLP